MKIEDEMEKIERLSKTSNILDTAPKLVSASDPKTNGALRNYDTRKLVLGDIISTIQLNVKGGGGEKL